MDLRSRKNGVMTLVVTKTNLHDGDDEMLFWQGIEPSERVAAVEILRQRVFGGIDEARSGLQRVCRVIRR